MEKFDAMNKDMFDEYVDGNSDGSATLEEIEMVSIIFHSQNELKKTIKIKFFWELTEQTFLISFLGRILHVPCHSSNDD